MRPSSGRSASAGSRRLPGSTAIIETAAADVPLSARDWLIPTGSAQATSGESAQDWSWSALIWEEVKETSTSSVDSACGAPNTTDTRWSLPAASFQAVTAEMFWCASPLVSPVRKTSSRQISATTAPIRA